MLESVKTFLDSLDKTAFHTYYTEFILQHDEMLLEKQLNRLNSVTTLNIFEQTIDIVHKEMEHRD